MEDDFQTPKPVSVATVPSYKITTTPAALPQPPSKIGVGFFRSPPPLPDPNAVDDDGDFGNFSTVRVRSTCMKYDMVLLH